MFNPMKRAVFSLGYLLPDAIIDNIHPLIKGSLAKKHRWSGMEQAEEYVRGRKLFQKFDEEILLSWLREGLKKEGGEGGGVELVFKHTSEACMYKTTPMETPIIGFKNGHMGQYDATDQNGVFLTSRKVSGAKRSEAI